MAALLLICLSIGSYREALLLIFAERAAEGGSASLIFGCKRDPFTETVRDCTCAEPENEENEPSMQYWKWDFPLPVMVPVLEMGGRPTSITGKLSVLGLGPFCCKIILVLF
jgi:hypothetical protein